MAKNAKGADARPELSTSRLTFSLPAASPEPLLVSPKVARELLGVGNSYFYESVLPELESCLIGRSRKISVASIRGYAERKLAEARK